MILGDALQSTGPFLKMPRVSFSACAALMTILMLSRGPAYAE